MFPGNQMVKIPRHQQSPQTFTWNGYLALSSVLPGIYIMPLLNPIKMSRIKNDYLPALHLELKVF